MSDRKGWDKGEYAERARDKDRAAAEHARKRDEAAREGRAYRPSDDRPKPTAHAQQHGDLGLDKDLGKTVLVSSSGKGQRGPGFYCELCDRTLKDSLSYLDHLNSGFHLRKLGQSTLVARSTVEQVRQRIAKLREESKTRVDAKNYDFNTRLNAVRSAEAARKEEKKAQKKAKREAQRKGKEMGKVGVLDPSDSRSVEVATEEMSGIESMMGFAGFGGRKK